MLTLDEQKGGKVAGKRLMFLTFKAQMDLFWPFLLEKADATLAESHLLK